MSVPRPVSEGSSSLSYKSESRYPQWEAQSQEETIVTFIDENAGSAAGTYAGNHAFSTSDGTVDTDIAAFFARPVLINSTTWDEADTRSIKTSIDPWRVWVDNTNVRRKLDNYAFMRGDLHIKIVISASPFYYGHMKAVYQPLPLFTPSTIQVDAGTRWLTPYSQRPHLNIDPQVQDAGSFVMPFLYPANYIRVGVANDFTALGKLDYVIYVPLQSANGASGVGVTVTTYAWMENIELSGATVAYSAQSDEYGEGAVSKPASMVAKAASYFEKVPILGPFATATRIGASAVSSIASLFGFTNVPVISNTVPQRPEAFPKLASSEISFPIEKLTLDPKNELSIDPRVFGMAEGIDELSIAHLCSKESYLTQSTWSTSNGVGNIMFYSRVNPRLYAADGATNEKVYMTPMAYVTNMFDSWRGDIIYKFKIVASPYHKGRLIVSYDPFGTSTRNLGNVLDTSNIVQTAIIDIGETNEVEFRVPYQQATQFLRLRQTYSAFEQGWATNFDPVSYDYDPKYDNGFLTLRVLNALTAPEASSTVFIMVSVSAAPNIEVGNPTNVDWTDRLSVYAPQSEVLMEGPTSQMSMTLGTESNAADNQYSVHFGENIRSLRQLLRRYEFVNSDLLSVVNGTTQLNSYVKYMYRMPLMPGYRANGYCTAASILGAGTQQYNWVNMTLLAYLTPSFVGYRGSINWTFNVLSGGNAVEEIHMSRNNNANQAAGIAARSYATSSVTGCARGSVNARQAGLTGQAITNGHTQSGFNVQLPNYSNYKFQSTYPPLSNKGDAEDGSLYDMCELLISTNRSSSGGAVPDTVVNSYVGAGTDFSLYFFLNVPTFWIYSAVPGP